MGYLEFQDEMYMDVVNDDACLIVASRGIGLEQLMVRLCRTYSDDTNLVIVIGTDPEDELFLMNQIVDEKDVPYGKLPQRITAESSNTKKRKEIYMNGGVLFVTERILVVDLLSNRVPLDLVTGLIVYKAHKIYNDCLMSFILRLYRLKNKKGFVKGLSQSPHSFFGDYGKLDRIMRELFVTTLHLWPRFHASVQASLAKPRAQPDVIEINLPMSQTMKNIQFDIMDLIDMCLKELAKTNTSFLYDSDQLNVENAIKRSFDGFIRRRFDGIWHQLSLKAKRLINDIQWLRNLLHLLTQSDVVTFYNHTRAARNSVRVGNEVSDWIFWKPADRLFKLAKERLYPNNREIADFDAETNLKWKAFQDLIDEIDQDTKDIDDTVNVFIITATDSIARLLHSILAHGATNVLRERVERFNAIMRSNTSTEDAIRLFGIQQDISEGAKRESDRPEDADSIEPPVKRRFRAKNPAAEIRRPEDNFTLTQIVRKMRGVDGEVITISEDDNEVHGETNNQENSKTDDPSSKTKRHHLKLHYFSSRDKHIVFESQLKEFEPMYFIMYDLDAHSIRQVEIYQALNCHPKRCKVYTIQFEQSCEMQQYLTSLRREKEAFENLIKEKATMVIPSGRNGKTDGHPDLMRGELRANETTDAVSSRRAGGQVHRHEIIQQKILVDMREFRSELPAVIHKRGIEIEPVQLEIGDYILSQDTCVERKSVSDLIQSLQSGRLFNQAAMMIRHFKRSILLIEFDESKSFHFKGRYWGIQTRTTFSSKKDHTEDLIDRLILLSIHHPMLRIVWSPSTHFTSELFEYLKVDRDQPDALKIAAISSQELPPETFEDRYDIQVRDFLLKLPGVNSRNVYAIMNCCPTLADLVDISFEEFEEILGNTRSAELFHQTLHTSLGKIISDAIQQEQESKRSRLFECTRRRKGLL